jgi:hypothetical protein
MRFMAPRMTAAAISIAVLGAGIGACNGDQRETAGQAHPRRAQPMRSVTLAHGVTASLPAGWQLVRKPINQVIYPVQVLAAASFPVELGETRPGCRRVLEQAPPSGALIQVIEYTRRRGLERFPPRKRPFRLPKAAYAPHECAGPSYSVAFRDHRRALQAFVILDRRRVDPRVRHEAIQLLGSIRLENQPMWRQVRRQVLAGLRRDFRTAIDGPSGFVNCFLDRFGRELTRKELRQLVALRAARGEPAAARALNNLAVTSGDVCGGRRWVPELTEAAHGLAAG